MKKYVTKVIDTLTQDDFHGALQKLLERYNKYIAAGGNYIEWDKSFMCVLSIKVLLRKNSGNLFNEPRTNIVWYARKPNQTKSNTLWSYVFLYKVLPKSLSLTQKGEYICVFLSATNDHFSLNKKNKIFFVLQEELECCPVKVFAYAVPLGEGLELFKGPPYIYLGKTSANLSLIRILNNENEKETRVWKWKYGLVSLFNGISTFVGYLIPKLFS